MSPFALKPLPIHIDEGRVVVSARMGVWGEKGTSSNTDESRQVRRLRKFAMPRRAIGFAILQNVSAASRLCHIAPA
jgi:hypothetical protein